MDPPYYKATAVRKVFTVNVTVSVNDLYGFEYKIKWNNTLLEPINISDFETLAFDVMWPEGYFTCRNATTDLDNGRSQHCLVATALGSVPGYTGKITLVTYTFQAKFQPSFPEPDGYSLLDLQDTKFSDPGANPIAHDTYDGEYIIEAAGAPPVAGFTYSPPYPQAYETVTFDASASYDPDGYIVRYEWKFGDETNGTGEITNHTYVDDGTYTVTLNVTDNDGLSNTTSVDIIVHNRSPVAIFTESAETIYTGQVITFNASDSYDLDGYIVNHLWDFGDDTNTTGMIVEHSYVDNGVYNVTLTVTDDDGATDTASSTKTVLNRPPVASFTESTTTVYTGEIIYFYASSSYDPDGSIVSYFWTFGDGINATGITVDHAYADNGTYTVALTVTDNDGITVSASATKIVLNRPPVAMFTESAETVLVGEVVYFNASTSYDPDGTIVSYFWDFGDGTNATAVTAEHAYADDGVYTVTLTVTDNDGTPASTNATKTVAITPPVAIFTESAETVYTGEVIAFDASESYDTDGAIVSYFWDFGDGSNASGMIVDHSYADDGDYTVTLTVTDDDGASASASATKTVLNRPPLAFFIYFPDFPVLGETVIFNASASYDPDGAIVSYKWNFGDGAPNVITPETMITHEYSAFGNYTITLIVTDNDGLQEEAQATITVIDYPTANFTYSPSLPLVGEIVTFNASESKPNGGIIISYEWSFGDGNVTALFDPVITHHYEAYGNYTVTLNVTDNEGLWDIESKIITVTAPPSAAYMFPMALLVVLLFGVGAIVCTMIGAFGYKKRELEKEKGRSGFSSRSIVGGSDGGDDSPNPGRNSGRSGSSSKFLVVKPMEKEAFSRRSMECFSSSKLRKESSSSRTPVSRRWVYSPGPFASKLREEGFSFRLGGAGSSGRPSSKSFLLAVVDLSRVRTKHSDGESGS